MAKIYIDGDEALKIFLSEAGEDCCVHLHVATIQGILNSVKSVEIDDDSSFITNEKRRADRRLTEKGGDKK